MKQWTRKSISWLTALILLGSCFTPMLVFAESETVSVVVEASVAEAPATATAAPETTAPLTPEATATPTPEATATPTPEATATPTAEMTATAMAATPTSEITTTHIVTASPTPEATTAPAPGTAAENCMPFSLNYEYKGALTAEQNTVYFKLDILSNQISATFNTSGLAVKIVLVNESNGARQELTPNKVDGVYIPLKLTLTLEQGVSYRLEVSAAEDGAYGGFSLLASKAVEKDAEPIAEASVKTTSELALETSAEPTAKPTAETSGEPTAEPMMATSTITAKAISYTCYDVGSLQSAHPYANGASMEWLYTAPGASTMYVTFSANTALATDGDSIYIYSGAGSVQYTYTGRQLAGQTITVPGDSLRIVLVTNDTQNDYGFAVVNIATSVHSSLAVSYRSDIPNVSTGSTVSLTIQQEAGWTIQYVIYRVISSSGQQVSSVVSHALNYSTSIAAAGTYYLLAIAYDGVSFGSCFSNTFTVSTPEKCAVSLSLSAGTVVVDQSITITTTQTAGGDIYFYRYIISDSTGAVLKSYDSGSATYTYTAPHSSCTLMAHVLAYDGYSWASAISPWFSVITPDPLEVSVSTTETSPKIDKPMTFTATYTGGYPVTFNRFTVRSYAGTTLYTVDTAANSISYTPTASGLCYVELLSYDGNKWAQAYRWFTVTAPIYRALIVGQTYASNPNISTLSGPPNDAAGMVRMLGEYSGTLGYSATKRLDLTYSGILSAISSTFVGTQSTDVSLFYYSGHGASGGCLIGTDGVSISPTTLRNALDKVPGKKIVIIDACYSGAIINKSDDASVNSKAANEEFTSSFIAAFTSSARSLDTDGYYVITASRSDEYSYEASFTSGGVTKNVGIFTFGLSRGCGWDYITERSNSKYADTDHNNILTLYEVYRYASLFAQTYFAQHAQIYPENSSYTLLY